MKRYVAGGRIVSGVLRIRRSADLQADLATWQDCQVTLTVEKSYATRSLPQNDYYWAVVVARIATTFVKREILPVFDPDVTHEILKSQFMNPELVRTGTIRGYIAESGLTIGTHTPDLSTLDFLDYLERIGEHAALHWETYIPPPDPLWREHAEREGSDA